MAISLIASASTDAASGTAVSLTHGLTIQSGDIIVALVHANGSGTTIVDNNGASSFTKRTEADSGATSHAAIFDRVAGGSEPSAYAFTLGSSQRWAIIVLQFRGVDASIYDVTPGAANLTTAYTDYSTPGGTQGVSASITIGTAGAYGLVLFFDDHYPTTTRYSSVDNSYSLIKEEYGQQLAIACGRASLSAGALGATTITLNSWASYGMWQFALKPAGAADTYSGRGIGRGIMRGVMR